MKKVITASIAVLALIILILAGLIIYKVKFASSTNKKSSLAENQEIPAEDEVENPEKSWGINVIYFGEYNNRQGIFYTNSRSIDPKNNVNADQPQTSNGLFIALESKNQELVNFPNLKNPQEIYKTEGYSIYPTNFIVDQLLNELFISLTQTDETKAMQEEFTFDKVIAYEIENSRSKDLCSSFTDKNKPKQYCGIVDRINNKDNLILNIPDCYFCRQNESKMSKIININSLNSKVINIEENLYVE